MIMRNDQHILNIFCVVIVLLCLFLFAYLIFGVMVQSEFRIDKTWLSFFSHQQTNLLTSYFSTMSWLGSKTMLILFGIFVLLILFYWKQYIAAVFYSLGFAGASLVGALLKVVVGRERPALYPSLVEMPLNPSFPSGHAVQITAISLCIIILIHTLRPKWQWVVGSLLLVVTVSVSISRIYLQVHYPSDVIGGILLAVSWVFILYWIFQWYWPEFSYKK